MLLMLQIRPKSSTQTVDPRFLLFQFIDWLIAIDSEFYMLFHKDFVEFCLLFDSFFYPIGNRCNQQKVNNTKGDRCFEQGRSGSDLTGRTLLMASV